MSHCIADCDVAHEITYQRGVAKRNIHYLVQEPQIGYALYPFDMGLDDSPTGFYIMHPQEATNLITNPTFYNGMEGWTAFNARMYRSSEWAFDMGFSAHISGSGDLVTAERRAYLETEILDYAPGNAYTATAYAWTPNLWDSQDDFMGTISIAQSVDNGVTITEVFSSRIDKANIWRRLGVTSGIDADATNVWVRLNLRSQDELDFSPPHAATGNFNLRSEYMYWDMVQFEKGVDATTPFHGDYNTCATNTSACGGYKWLGEAHNSASYRSDCTRDGGVLRHLSELGFEILSHSGHGAPPVRDISFPYANKPGSHYQKTAVDDRILTLNGFCCDMTLKDLECCIFGFSSEMWPSIGQCMGKFLLVYHHGDDCVNHCDGERDLALCVTYNGGLEGNRDNHYQQRFALQFKAHDPVSWFEWPGHSSQAIDVAQVSSGNKLVRLNQDGSLTGYPIDAGIEVNTANCLPGVNEVIMAGEFTQINENSTDENIAIFQCDGFCPSGFGGLTGGAVNVSASDGQGNVILGGAFNDPFVALAVYYPGTGTWGGFTSYPGAEVTAIGIPFWGDVIVGDVNNQLHIGFDDGTWETFTANGAIRDIKVDNFGNIVVVGDFTTIGGIVANYAAIYNVNTGSCLDITTGAWESGSVEFNGPMTSIAVDQDSNAYYIGGEATLATPISQTTCQVSTTDSETSKSNDQQIHFRQIAGTIYEVEFRLESFTTRNLIFDCLNAGDAVRVTATNPTGGIYEVVIVNAQFGGAVLAGPDINGHLNVTVTVNTAITIGEPCATQNVSLLAEVNDSNADIIKFATFDISNPTAGLGIDDAINNYIVECLEITDSFQGEDIEINHIACVANNNVSALGDGLASPVNEVFIHPLSKEIWAGTEVGLFIWNGNDWCPFPGQIACNGNVIKMQYCPIDCSVLILHGEDAITIAGGSANIDYLGSFEDFDMQLHLQGPMNLENFAHLGDAKRVKFCTTLGTGENAIMNFSNGSFTSNYRPNLGHTILAGSKPNITLNKCDNPFSLYGDNDSGCTKAVMIWRNKHWGIEALCCSPKASPEVTGGCDDILRHRCPDNSDDCLDYPEGTLWAAYTCDSCPCLYISTGVCCEDDLGFIDENGEPIMIGADGLCPP